MIQSRSKSESESRDVTLSDGQSRSQSIVLSVEEMIGLCFGHMELNTVNFKMLEAILHLLAQQLNILEYNVQLKYQEEKQLRDELEMEKEGVGLNRARPKKDGIEIVDRSEFDALEAQVLELMNRNQLVPLPTMPDDMQLKRDVAKGTTSLPGTMKALQINARVQAAEQALIRMAGILRQLAEVNTFPQELAQDIEQTLTDMKALQIASQVAVEVQASLQSHSVTKDSKVKVEGTKKDDRRGEYSLSRNDSQSSEKPAWSTLEHNELLMVRYPDMVQLIDVMKKDFNKRVINLTQQATSMGERANSMAVGAMEKLDTVIQLDTHLDSMQSLIEDYGEQLSGFDSGMGTQFQSYQEQMAQIRKDLAEALVQLELSSSSESNAVLELKKTHQRMSMNMAQILNTSQALTETQDDLTNELKNLLEWVENLREQKIDRDEVLDGLKDKADNRRLLGLLGEHSFQEIYSDLENRLNLCYTKFNKQEKVWQEALADLANILDLKAEASFLQDLKDSVSQSMQELKEAMWKAVHMLGEPMTSLLVRQLNQPKSGDATTIPEAKVLQDGSSITPKKQLQPGNEEPATLPREPAMEQPCERLMLVAEPPDRKHACKRWAGGSHTIVSTDYVRHEQAPSVGAAAAPTQRYTGYGSDNRLYLMETELVACQECNLNSMGSLPVEIVPEVGGGDGGALDRSPEVVGVKDLRRVESSNEEVER